MRITIPLLVMLIAGGYPSSATPAPTSVPPPDAVQGAPASPPTLCYPTGVPKPAAVPVVDKSVCRELPAIVTRTLDAELGRRFRPSVDGATLGIERKCSPLGATIAEVVFERGSGHGASLELWRMTRSKDGKSYDLHGLAYAESPIGNNAQGTKPVVKVARAVVSAELVTPHLDAVAAGLMVQLREVKPPLEARRGLAMRGGSSSADFHLLVGLRDLSGRQIQGHFTGYPNSNSELRYLPLVVTAEPLHTLLQNIEFKETTVTEEDRAHFAERLFDGQTRFDNDFSWWVTEREVSMARSFGSPPTIPILLSRLSPQKRNRFLVNDKRNAVDAIAQISGWDIRLDEKGRERPLEDVAKEYLRECSRASE